MNTNLIPFVNHSGLDTVNQRRIAQISSTKSIQLMDYIIKLNGIFSGPIAVTDTYLLDHRPLQNWLLNADTGVIEYLAPQNDSVIPGFFVTTRAKGSFEDILKVLLKNRMLFSSQNKVFDDWIKNLDHDPSIDEFVNKDKRGHEWWNTYLKKIDTIFDNDIRRDWMFGPFNFPKKLKRYLNNVELKLKPKDPYAWDYFDNLLARTSPPITRTEIVRWLRDNDRSEGDYITLVHSAYRAVLAESMDIPGKVIESVADDTWPKDLIPKAITRAAEKFMEVKPEEMDFDYKILIDKLPWDALLELRSHEDFKQSLLELSTVTSSAIVDFRTVKRVIKNHLRITIGILRNTSAANLFINRSGTPPIVTLKKFGSRITGTSAATAAALLTKRFDVGLTAIAGWGLVIEDLIGFVGSDPRVRLINAFGHVERTLLKNIEFDE
jgi:hypothetical protein